MGHLESTPIPFCHQCGIAAPLPGGQVRMVTPLLTAQAAVQLAIQKLLQCSPREHMSLWRLRLVALQVPVLWAWKIKLPQWVIEGDGKWNHWATLTFYPLILKLTYSFFCGYCVI